MDVIFAKALEVLASFAGDKAKEKLARTEVVVRALDAVGFKPDTPPADFDGVYVYSLIQYGAGRPAQALQLFRQPEIRSAFRRSFEKNDPTLLDSEAESFLEWNRIGDEVRAGDIDLRREFALFSAAFDQTVDATRNPADTRRDLQLAEILKRLEGLPDLPTIRSELSAMQQVSRGRQFVQPASGGKLKIFISSRMQELRDLRSILQEALEKLGFNAFLYESQSGSRPDTVVEASLSEVEAADIYLGIFESSYGAVTIEEFRHARNLNKPCFVYIRDRNAAREPRLQRFLDQEVFDLRSGVAPAYFDAASQLAKQAAEDIMAWLVREYRVKSALARDVGTSQEEQERLRKELDRLRTLVDDKLPEGGVVDLLGANLDSWFRVSGYPVEASRSDRPGLYSRIINVPDRARKSVRVLIHAVDGPAELHHLFSLRKAADGQGVPEAWLITAARKSPAVISQIENPDPAWNAKLACYTFDEVIDLGADFTGYFNWLETEVEDRGIDKQYIALASTKAEFDPETNQRIGESLFEDNTDSYIDKWLGDPSKEHISILGQFGTGKTWFALHYAWVALRRYREAQQQGLTRPRLPIYIPLRDYSKAVDVKNLLSEFFFSKQQIDIRNYSMFEELNRMGRFVLIFDGFDEMADRVDRERVIEHFWKLAQVVAPRSKVILTSRTEHFPNDEESRRLLNAELQAATSNLKMTSPKFEVLELRQLTREQIRRLLAAQGLGPADVKRVLDDKQLTDLASRPVMIELIRKSITEIKRGDRVDLSRIYLYATRRKMEEDIKSGRTFTSLADKLYFLCELSWAMLSQGKMALNYKDFPAEIGRVFGSRVKGSTDRDYIQYDMMGQTMLIRKDGDYTPAHRSLLEFWAAYKLAAEMGILAEDFTAAARSQSGLDPAATPEDRSWSEHFGLANPRPNALGRFTQEPVEQLKKTFGAAPISQAIRDLLIPMLEPQSAPALIQLIKRSADDPDPAAAIISANALTLLLGLDSIDLKTIAGFARVRFHGMDLKGPDFGGVDFSGAVFENCRLASVNFLGTQLVKTTWSHCQVTAADLRHTDLRSATFSESSFSLSGIYPHVAINRPGVLAIAPQHDDVELWDMASGKRLGGFSTRFLQSLTFLSTTLLCAQSLNGIQLWDISNPRQPAEAAWPGDAKVRAVCSIQEKGHAWLLTGESLVPADLAMKTVGEPVEIDDDTGDILAAADDEISVAAAGARVQFWHGPDRYSYDPNKKQDEENRVRDFRMLAYSPSSLLLAAITKRNLDRSENTAAGYIINRETLSVTRWDFADSEAICFASEDLFLNFTNTALHLSSLSLGKQIARIRYEYAPYCSINAERTAMIYCDSSGVLRLIDISPFLATDSWRAPLFPGDFWKAPSFPAGIPPDDAALPEWWRNTDPRPAVPQGHIPNPRFGTTVFSLVVDRRCEGMSLTGVAGLSGETRDAFIDRGAEYKPGLLERVKSLIT